MNHGLSLVIMKYGKHFFATRLLLQKFLQLGSCCRRISKAFVTEIGGKNDCNGTVDGMLGTAGPISCSSSSFSQGHWPNLPHMSCVIVDIYETFNGEDIQKLGLVEPKVCYKIITNQFIIGKLCHTNNHINKMRVYAIFACSQAWDQRGESLFQEKDSANFYLVTFNMTTQFQMVYPEGWYYLIDSELCCGMLNRLSYILLSY